jgi:tetrahydromethanopterin S-methyltransferase subunit H
MFYARHKIVSDPEHGVFDVAAAERLWNTQVEMSEVTGNSCMNQIVAESNEAMAKEIDWFVGISDYPFLIDSSAPEVRAFGVKHATEIGVADRAIHNSINASITPEELAAVKESDLDSGLILVPMQHVGYSPGWPPNLNLPKSKTSCFLSNLNIQITAFQLPA